MLGAGAMELVEPFTFFNPAAAKEEPTLCRGLAECKVIPSSHISVVWRDPWVTYTSGSERSPVSTEVFPC